MLITLSNQTQAFQTVEFELVLERQRPCVVNFAVEEPIDPSKPFLLALGEGTQVFSCGEVQVTAVKSPDGLHFECFAVGLLHGLLETQVRRQISQKNYLQAFKTLAAEARLGFTSQLSVPSSQVESLVVLGSLRNGLDQLQEIYSLGASRWYLDPAAKRLVLLEQGHFPVEPVPLPVSDLVANLEEGPELAPLCGLIPYLPVVWAGKTEVLDKVSYRSSTGTMCLRFASYSGL
ncbi:MAG: hypothetical protein A2600_08870 [Candidatus Lambdaproteobacteria bacterium RIFOXYD1_FULL_56_27]|uniref:Uncharacterized protein n=1 Tax=Candidatus Lambdaproteobacteria bacterium RIFOXYD2_FULL_56_26 TaxID=1817773 RepID=A0A1F6GYV7_9PROT|nr:MAG: hypothetical protein A2426_10290 [Candidatus Lambdaproteobacteria bacterium RIFOXYC1_FULL_56_13]OGH03353.1 MAG: hypothetical protein A2557_02395 [Candidatus Lambdaproteobacteria bacterium RIFOXYD2_FULL_56_26]OGH06642.1 MAG: hypothetical protein A2600_08870 [Candidatus Lambdaproteobacteria bacterium RIFOXYD1_FULL_56_27]